MVQLAKKITMPKANKKEIAKNKTPSKSPQAVVMKAKDKNTPKMKKMVQKHLVTPEQMETSTITPINNKKNNKKSPQKMEIGSQGEESASLPETPKSKKKSNKQSPPKIEVDSKQDVKTPATSPNKKRNNKSKKGNNKAENQQNESVEVEKKEVKIEKEKLEVPAQTPNIKKNKKSRKLKTENKQNESVEVEIEKEILEAQTPNAKMNKKSKKVKSENKQKEAVEVEKKILEAQTPNAKMNKKSKKVKSENKQKEAVEVEKKILEAPAQTPNAKKNKNLKKVKKDTENKQNESVTLPETQKMNKKSPQKEVSKVEDVKTDAKNKKYQFSVFARGLDFKLETSEVIDHFSKYGAVNAYLPKNRDYPDQANAGYCFLEFKKKEDMLNAMDGNNVLGNRTVVLCETKADSKRKREDNDSATAAPHVEKKQAVSADDSIYIGRLDPTTSKKTVKEYFSKYGKVDDVKVIGPSGNSKGFGFVTFAHSIALEKVLAKTHTIDNREILCNKKGTPDVKKLTKKNDAHEVMVTLSSAIEKEDFENYFNGIGNVQSITFPQVKVNSSQKNKGYAFVAFDTAVKMNEVIAMSHEINNSKLTVKSAHFQPKRDKDQSRKCEILLRNIPTMSTKDELRETFSEFGEIEWVTLPLNNRDDPSEGCKRFGFIAYKNEKSMKTALEASSIEFKGELVQIIDPKEPRVTDNKPKKEVKVKEECEDDDQEESDEDEAESDEDEAESNEDEAESNEDEADSDEDEAESDDESDNE